VIKNLLALLLFFAFTVQADDLDSDVLPQTSNFNGIVRKVLVSDDDVVEEGQPLFEIEGMKAGAFESVNAEKAGRVKISVKDGDFIQIGDWVVSLSPVAATANPEVSATVLLEEITQPIENTIVRNIEESRQKAYTAEEISIAWDLAAPTHINPTKQQPETPLPFADTIEVKVKGNILHGVDYSSIVAPQELPVTFAIKPAKLFSLKGFFEQTQGINVIKAASSWVPTESLTEVLERNKRGKTFVYEMDLTTKIHIPWLKILQLNPWQKAIILLLFLLELFRNQFTALTRRRLSLRYLLRRP
jgi:hypothetical protein